VGDFPWVVFAQVLDRFIEAGFYVAGAENLEECYEDGFALLAAGGGG